MIDSGHNSTTGWRPSTFIRHTLGRSVLDYLFITNADQDHLSDLEGLWTHGVAVSTLYRNRSISEPSLRGIKEAQGELTNDVQRFLSIHASYTSQIDVPFDAGMGGATIATFWNTYPAFTDTNNLSLVVFVRFGAFKILFPGDMEKAGWMALLNQPAFVNELGGTDVLVASHHGRDNGFCEDVFRYFTPRAVVISDKPIVHETQEIVPDYRAVVSSEGVFVASQNRRRHVLTTRRDGDIIFTVFPNGDFKIDTTSYGT